MVISVVNIELDHIFMGNFFKAIFCSKCVDQTNIFVDTSHHALINDLVLPSSAKPEAPAEAEF